jgi:hypothetical protein
MCLLACNQSHIIRGRTPSGRDLAQSLLQPRQQPSCFGRVSKGGFEWHGRNWTHQGSLQNQRTIPPLKQFKTEWQGPLRTSPRSVYVLASKHQRSSRIQNRKCIPPSEQIRLAWGGPSRFSGSPYLLLDQHQRLSKMVVAKAAESSPSELQQTCPSLLRKVDAFDKSFSAWLYGDGRTHLRSLLKFLELSGETAFSEVVNPLTPLRRITVPKLVSHDAT